MDVVNVYNSEAKMGKLTEVVSTRITKEMDGALRKEAVERGLRPCDIARWAIAHYLGVGDVGNIPASVRHEKVWSDLVARASQDEQSRSG